MNPNKKLQRSCSALVVCLLALASLTANAGPVRERLKDRQQAHTDALDDERGEDNTKVAFAPEVRVLRDIAYGNDYRQRFDVYLPPWAENAPVIFMVHGGGWRNGDKTMRSVVQNKVNRWVPRGFVLVSVNYRLLPTDPVEQARDVARALATAQAKAAQWGGDRRRFVLMGHSAGAHLVALLAASPNLTAESSVTPWLGEVLLDSAAFDIERIMRSRHLPLYDHAFGTDPHYWTTASPLQMLNKVAAPALAVCSSRRLQSCSQADAFVAKATSLGGRARTLSLDLSHREINERLGEADAYTQEVEAFMRSLDGALAGLL